MRQTSSSPDADLEQMRADAVLPSDVEPAGLASQALPSTVLLTGATGFVGAHLLHTLLRDTQANVVCLVRPSRRGAMGERIRHNMQLHGLWDPASAERICPMAGDLRLPGLGWSESQRQELAAGVDAIYHSGAAVNWVHGYHRLHAANVAGTLELLRLACQTRAKPFHFLSTIGVCYATGATGSTVTESDDPEPLLDRLHLGYAQSKSVAESLVRQARQRGLPAVVYRPTLITGHSQTGAANPDDFLARGIGACVRMGCAPDIDWCIDACPVDHVARVMVQYGTLPRGAADVLHLIHPQPRQWRELVLWMRLFGYPLELRPYSEWSARLERTARKSDLPLRPLLGFFRASATGMTLPETYLGNHRNRVCAERTSRALADQGLDYPPLDTHWLERFFASLTAHGVVPARRQIPAVNKMQPPNAVSQHDCLTRMLRRHFDDPDLVVKAARPAERLSHQSILTELTSWRSGSTVGLFRQPLELSPQRAEAPRSLDVVIKIKVEDRHLLDVAEAAAAQCNRRVGAAFARWRHHLGLQGNHLREIALYGQADERWKRLTPECYGANWDAEERRGLIVLESLGPEVWMDPCTETTAWRPAQVEAAVRGLAELHAIWFDRTLEPADLAWLGPIRNADGMVQADELWSALATYAARFFAPWLGAEVRRVQRRLLARIERCWQRLDEMPHTLIHNDFNPRNLALRPGPAGPVLCAFDWELATWGVPQHDLAQLLCFVLPFDCSRSVVSHYLELHRRTLEDATGRQIDATDWQRGFGLALADLLINRWAMYTLVHTIRPQPFLPRVLKTWQTLYTFSSAND